jgi:sulfoxide reductase heme-binding subunit YedZ
MASVARSGRPRFQFTWLQIVTHLGAWVPLAVMVWDGFNANLTANPINELQLRTGKTALVLLILSLSCTPLSAIAGFHAAIKLRRPLGLYAFGYVLIHISLFLFNYSFDPAMLLDAVFRQQYVVAGFAAFCILLALAVTSTKGWQRRMGKSWTRLHRLVYLAGPIVIIHFIWQMKDPRQALEFGAVVAALLVVRIPSVKMALRSAAHLLVPRGGKPAGRERAVPEAKRGREKPVTPQ